MKSVDWEVKNKIKQANKIKGTSESLQSAFNRKANTMNPYQTAHKGSYCLQYKPPKYISR